MFNILSHKGNANQNYTKITSFPSQNGSQEEKKQQMLAKVIEKKKILCTVSGNGR
jgi:hypothetical protein